MLSSLASLNSVADALVDRAMSVAWQWTALVVVLALPAHWLLRRQSPTLRYWVWQIVLLKLLVMPFWTYAVPVGWLPATPAPAPAALPIENFAPSRPTPIAIDPATEPAAPVPIAIDEAEPVSIPILSTPKVAWSVWLCLIWGTIVLFQILRLVLQRHRLSRLLSAAAPANSSVVETVQTAAQLLGLSTPPRVLLTGEMISPFVCGTIRSTLVLPAELAAALPADQLRQVVLHELAHVRRHDLLWGWIPQLARMLWFAHPVVHWVVYHLRLERELACDQLAMTLSGKNAADYAQTLVDVVTQTSAHCSRETSSLLQGGAGRVAQQTLHARS